MRQWREERERSPDAGATGEEAKQSCEKSSECPLATSPIGLRVAAEGLGVPSH